MVLILEKEEKLLEYKDFYLDSIYYILLNNFRALSTFSIIIEKFNYSIIKRLRKNKRIVFWTELN